VPGKARLDQDRDYEEGRSLLSLSAYTTATYIALLAHIQSAQESKMSIEPAAPVYSDFIHPANKYDT
jgi:hypothetical protein